MPLPRGLEGIHPRHKRFVELSRNETRLGIVKEIQQEAFHKTVLRTGTHLQNVPLKTQNELQWHLNPM